MSNIIINVKKPEPLDDGILDTIFNRSIAISNAVSKFWSMKLASQADLGKVTETETGYNVEIVY